jgi:hypothetical protein
MADDDKAQAGHLPKIGQLIEPATGLNYDSYKPDQDKLGLQAAMAAIADHPEIAGAVDGLLKQQAELRTNAVTVDMDKILAGKALEDLPPVVMKDGKVQMGALFMPDLAQRSDPKLTADDKGKLDAAVQAMKDPNWLVAEGASNISNFARDMEVMVNGKALDKTAIVALREGIQAERTLQRDLVTGTSAGPAKAGLERTLENAMDVAAHAAGIDPKDAVYQHYRREMHKGIDDGLEAISKLHAAGVTPTDTTGPATTAPVIPDAGNGKGRK